MKKIRKRLSPTEALHLGFEVKPNDKGRTTARYMVSRKQLAQLKALENSSDTSDYGGQEVLSAVGSDGGIMDIDSYCSFYRLPRTDITSYKLVTHTGTPFYNIVFKEKQLDIEDIDYGFIEELVKKHIKTVDLDKKTHETTETFDRVVFTDVHVGMHPNKSGNALYGGKWDEEELTRRRDVMVEHILSHKESDFLILDDLGDLLDGWDGHTVRKGHALPQNMTNQEAFDVAVSFKVGLVDAVQSEYNRVLFNNICEDNHSGAFGYVVNSAVKMILEQKYKNVEVVNHEKFMNHYYVGNHCFVISHGKDSHALKFGFKPFLDTKQIEKIDQYLKQSGIYKRASFIEFSKGDSHQMLFDYCTSDDFDYCNYPALSPSSEWVQTNFKKGRSGFVMQICDYNNKNKKIIPYMF